MSSHSVLLTQIFPVWKEIFLKAVSESLQVGTAFLDVTFLSKKIIKVSSLLLLISFWNLFTKYIQHSGDLATLSGSTFEVANSKLHAL